MWKELIFAKPTSFIYEGTNEVINQGLLVTGLITVNFVCLTVLFMLIYASWTICTFYAAQYIWIAIKRSGKVLILYMFAELE